MNDLIDLIDLLTLVLYIFVVLCIVGVLWFKRYIDRKDKIFCDQAQKELEQCINEGRKKMVNVHLEPKNIKKMNELKSVNIVLLCLGLETKTNKK